MSVAGFNPAGADPYKAVNMVRISVASKTHECYDGFYNPNASLNQKEDACQPLS
jgi:hypothetical protein